MKSTANWTPLVLTIVLACGDSTPPEPPNTPPEAVGTIENWEMAVGDRLSVPNLGRFFTDADGDSLTYTAEFSGDTVVTLQVSGGSTLIGITTGGRGTATVTVTATDPDSATAEQEFEVTVANRSPVGQVIPNRSLVILTQDSLDAGDYFSDPDGDGLTYTAVSSDTEVVTVNVNGEFVTLSAGTEEATVKVTVTAMDEYGDSAFQSFDLTIYDNIGFRDDFDTSSSLDDWQAHWVRARVVDSMLVLDEQSEQPDSLPWRSYVYRKVDPVSHGWSLSFSVVLSSDDEKVIPSIMVFTGDSIFPFWFVNLEWEREWWEMYAYDIVHDEWKGALAGGEITWNHDEYVIWEWTLEADAVMRFKIDNNVVFDRSLVEPFGELPVPVEAIGVGLGFLFWAGENPSDNGVIYDFVEFRRK